MAIEITPGIVIDPNIRFGKPVVKGRRVDVMTIIGHLAAGGSFEEAMEQYHLEREDILAALRFALDELNRKYDKYSNADD